MKRSREREGNQSALGVSHKSAALATARVGVPVKEPASSSSINLDLDDLFSNIGVKKAAKAAEVISKESQTKAREAKSKADAAALKARLEAMERAGRAANGIRGDESPKALRFDAVLGVKVFSVDSLKIGQGSGDTPQCPFDCNCCF